MESLDAEMVDMCCQCGESFMEFCVDYFCSEEETRLVEIVGGNTVVTVLNQQGNIYRTQSPIEKVNVYKIGIIE